MRKKGVGFFLGCHVIKHRGDRKVANSPKQSKNEKLGVRNLKIWFSGIKCILGSLTPKFGWRFKPLERFWDPLPLPGSKNYISTPTTLKPRRSTPFQPEGGDHGDSSMRYRGALLARPKPFSPSVSPPPVNAEAGSAEGTGPG